MEFNGITEGLIKAFGFIAEKNRRDRFKGSDRYTYENDGTAIHHARRLTSDEALEVSEAVQRLQAATTDQEGAVAMAALRRLRVNLVPLKRAIRKDTSRYTGEKLREIRAAGGGAKESARAARRATPLLQAAE